MSGKIKDSGNRTKFKTGAVRDVQEGRGRCDLLPLDIISEFFDNDECIIEVYNFQQDGEYYHLFNSVKNFIDSGELGGNYCTAMLEYSVQMENGCKKYPDDNWKKGVPIKNYINSAIRHYLKYKRGDTDERHDRAFVWNCLCAAWTVKNMPELNDYKK